MNVEHEDVVHGLFLYTFENKESTWYCSQPIYSITSWDDIENEFINKFGEEKIPATLLKELIAIKM